MGVDTHFIVRNASELADCRNCLCLASRKAARKITAFYDRRLRSHGVRVTQFTILAMLMLRGATPLTVLAKSLGMDRTTLTRNVALLEARGWARIDADDADARSHVISVTGAGEKVVQAALPAWREAQAKVAEAFGPTGMDALHRLARTEIP